MKKRSWRNIKDSKDRGAWAELCFAARAMEEGLRPARPFGEPSGYDFLVHHKSRRLFRIQVKSTIRKQYRCYACTIRTQNHIYKKDSFDFVAALVVPEDVWYILPERVVRGMSTVGLSPTIPGSTYDEYKEAWHLLRGEKPGKVTEIQARAEDPAAGVRRSVIDHAVWTAPFVLATRFMRWKFDGRRILVRNRP